MTCPTCLGLGYLVKESVPSVRQPCPKCRPLAAAPIEQDGAVRSEGNVRILGVVTHHDIPPERILSAASEAGLKLCIVVGELADGEFYFASNHSDGPDVLWALERAKLQLLKAGGAG